ncbi:unnamed protein product [Aphanomyces euteiches]
MKIAATLALLSAIANGQQVGTNTPEVHPPLPSQTCTSSGGCKTENTKLVLDANWRWTHNVGGSTNCYTGNTWNSALCPDPATCATNCALDGADYSGTYGISTSGQEVSLKLVTHGPYSTNVGSRLYLLEDDNNYKLFKLLNQEFTFDVDASQLPCGLNGALYFVQMDKDGGKSKYTSNKAGAAYGTGYCDAQCPHDIKFINGEANVKNWTPSKGDPNAGSGQYGSCCAEMDIWESNSISQAYTSHPCTVDGQTRCSSPTECGDDATNNRFDGVCDKDGCDFNPYRMNSHNFYGPGSNFKVDSTKPITVVTQFITDDNTANGNLVEIKRFYVQNGKAIDNSAISWTGIDPVNSLTDKVCDQAKTVFGDTNDHSKKGGLKVMGDALKKGVVLTMSLWVDYAANCLWLDSTYPVTKNPSVPGAGRGTCATSSGVPADVLAQSGSATVKYGNIRVGDLGSTTSVTPPSPSPSTPSVTPSSSPAPITDAPSDSPTDTPSDSPTDAPSDSPTDAPSDSPTDAPSDSPTEYPPTDAPSDSPTEYPPTDAPSDSPTDAPSDAPSDEPTDSPSNEPTDAPSDDPTDSPSDSPTEYPPTDAPSDSPTDAPSDQPTPAPSPTAPSDSTVPIYYQCGGINHKGPTQCAAGLICKEWNEWYFQCIAPESTFPSTDSPTDSPTDAPAEPTESPAPTETPQASKHTKKPRTPKPTKTIKPTKVPKPTKKPRTPKPTNSPSEVPTDAPTDAPTDFPTDAPSTDVPTDAPSDGPTDSPSDAPTDVPTDTPSDEPTDAPSDAPTDAPSEVPTNSPTDASTEVPTDAPTDAPTDTPTTIVPTSAPANGLLSFEAKLDGIYLNGSPFIFKGANYFGLETDISVPHGLWGGGQSTTIAKIAALLKSNGFNAVRLPFAVDAALSNKAIDPSKIVNEVALLKQFSGKTLSYFDVMDYTIKTFADNKIVVLLDAHVLTGYSGITDLWYSSSADKDNFENAWKIVANRYKNTWNVIAADLKNEPHGSATWGSGNSATDWNQQALKIATTIQAIVPRWLIFVEGVAQSSRDQAAYPTFWGENLMDVQRAPITLPVANRLVYSPHVYGPDVSSQPYFSASNYPDNMPNIWDLHFGFVNKKYGPLVVGEWGGKYLSTNDIKWQDKFASYLKTNSIGFFYWSLNPNSGDTQGLLADDWNTPRTDKLKMLSVFKGTAIP